MEDRSSYTLPFLDILYPSKLASMCVLSIVLTGNRTIRSSLLPQASSYALVEDRGAFYKARGNSNHESKERCSSKEAVKKLNDKIVLEMEMIKASLTDQK